MNIIVEGRGKKSFKADKINVRFNFLTNRPTYELAVSDGTKNVEIFLNDILHEMNFTKDDLKTESFRVFEEIKYDFEKKENIKDGFSYSQTAVLSFDYSAERLAEMIARISSLENAPKYFLSFDIKDLENAKKEVLAEAYIKAREKAEIIANVAGKKLVDCLKTDFRPFEESIISKTNLDPSPVMYESERVRSSKNVSVEDSITKVFTPQDIEIVETLYCLWLAE